MSYLSIVPFLVLGILMSFDEFYYHFKRGLPLWERIGHPFDSLTVFACALFCYLSDFTSTNIWYFILLFTVSIISITKDEFVHQKYCDGGEQWFHSILFILHPLMILGFGLLWYLSQTLTINRPGELYAIGPSLAKSILLFQTIAILLYTFYQIIFWNVLANKFNWNAFNKKQTLKAI